MRALALLLLAASALSASSAAAQFGPSPYGQRDWSGWDRSRQDQSWPERRGFDSARQDDREGEVDVASFHAEGIDPATLGHGPITLGQADQRLADGRVQATFEAAVIDRLAAAGYDTTAAMPEGGQQAELRVVQRQVEPAEGRRKPVSGAMEVGVGTHGTSTAIGIAVDLRKPLGALISTRMELRIRDAASGDVLWEGRATMLTREGEDRWSDDAVARKLAGALFDEFPAAAS